MTEWNFDERLLEEIEDIIDLDRDFSETRKVPVIFDGSQYTIKIPKKIAQKANLSDEKFEFYLKSSYKNGKRHTEVTGRFVRE